MKKLLIISFFLSIYFQLSSQEFEWAIKFEDILTSDIKTDKLGNIYIIGEFTGTVDFDPGIDIHTITAPLSPFSFFILKLDKNGKFLWVKSIVGVDGKSLAIDSNTNVYITGYFTNITVDFDPGNGVFNLQTKAGSDAFILKINENGEFIWAKSLAGSKADVGKSIYIDSENNIYATGYYGGKINFNIGTDTFSLNSNASNGNYDIYIFKLKENGNFLWGKSIGAGLEEKDIASIIADSNNDILITGDFSGTIDFDPGAGTYNLSTIPGEFDVFLLKLNKNGDFVWAKSIPERRRYEIVSIIFDSNDGINISGTFENTIDFDLSSNTYTLTSKGGTDVFILKLDKNGDFIWVKSFGGIGYDSESFLDIDNRDNLYILGNFAETVNFDTGNNSSIVSSNGQSDVYILKLNKRGDFVWVKTTGGVSFDVGNKIIVDSKDNIIVYGEFNNKVDFDPGIDTFYLTGSWDAFILKLSQCPTSFDTMQVNTCDSYTWIDGKTYTESTDTAEYILTNAQGCDSIVSLDLTIYKKDSIGMQITACNEYIWKDDTLKNTDIYRYDTLNIYGCDSTVTLDLIINKSSDSNLKITSCDSYIWHDSSYTQSGIYRFDTINAVGCDSTVTLDLTLNSSSSTTLEKSACESYTWHDSINTSGGTYRFDTVNITGCDSTVTLNLTIVDKIEKLDTMYICQGDTIEIYDSEIWEEKLVSKTFISQKGCDSIQKIQVVVKPLPEGTITESICEGDSIFVVNLWISEEGTYTIHKENAGECDSLYSVNITLRPLKYSYDTIDICKGDTIEVFGFEISTETDVEKSYVGSNDCDSTAYIHITILPISSSQSQITLCPGDSILIAGNWIKSDGKYQEHLTGKNGCDSTANIQVKVLTKPEEPSIEIDCDIPEIILSTTAATPWHIQWDNGDTTSQSTYQNQSQAILTLQTDMGCKEIYTIALPTLPDLAQIPNLQDTTIDLNQTLSIGINPDTSQWQINWSPEEIIDCPSCQNISISPEESTVIKLSMTHSSGCTYSREFTLYVQEPELEIPNIFTPNGDGINDNWTFRVPKEIKLISCTIFDRWGEKIYQTKGNTPINWDGKYKSGSVLSGVYVYIIEYVDSKGENRVLAGDVTVVR